MYVCVHVCAQLSHDWQKRFLCGFSQKNDVEDGFLNRIEQQQIFSMPTQITT